MAAVSRKVLLVVPAAAAVWKAPGPAAPLLVGFGPVQSTCPPPCAHSRASRLRRWPATPRRCCGRRSSSRRRSRRSCGGTLAAARPGVSGGGGGGQGGAQPGLRWGAASRPQQQLTENRCRRGTAHPPPPHQGRLDRPDWLLATVLRLARELGPHVDFLQVCIGPRKGRGVDCRQHVGAPRQVLPTAAAPRRRSPPSSACCAPFPLAPGRHRGGGLPRAVPRVSRAGARAARGGAAAAARREAARARGGGRPGPVADMGGRPDW
jgi:hypothetical protein